MLNPFFCLNQFMEGSMSMPETKLKCIRYKLHVSVAANKYSYEGAMWYSFKSLINIFVIFYSTYKLYMFRNVYVYKYIGNI